MSRKDSFRNAFNNRLGHPTVIEEAPDLPSLEIEKQSLSQQLKRVEKEMKDVPDVLSLAVERMSLLQRLEGVEEEIKTFEEQMTEKIDGGLLELMTGESESQILGL